MTVHRRLRSLILGALAVTVVAGPSALGTAAAQEVEKVVPLTAAIKPPTANLTGIVADKLALQQLGKALFWDLRVGSDGVACASCHFHAGSDIRIRNIVNPGFDGAFSTLPSGLKAGPNVTLNASDFPFRKLANPDDRQSAILYDTNDVASSPGTFAGQFVSRTEETAEMPLEDYCDLTYDVTNPFHDYGLIHRKVEPRQTPSNINAVFNVRQFWDGRANAVFNGVDPFGRRTNLARPSAGVLVKESASIPALRKLELSNSSLASQAVGPPLSDFEMSCAKRRFADIGRKLAVQFPLSTQYVHSQDSLFSRTPGLINASNNRGLTRTYGDLVRKAFASKYWSAANRYDITSAGKVVQTTGGAGYTQLEHNFSFFFGLALQEYQATLISDRSPFDLGTMSAAASRGKAVFEGKGKCAACHNGPLMSNATAYSGAKIESVERMVMGDGGVALYDRGFYNIGVRPTEEDIGLGGKDPYGNPLSFSRQYVLRLMGKAVPDKFSVNPCDFEVPFVRLLCKITPIGSSAASIRTAVDGAFKTPILRNVALTPPYFHNGGQATLEQVVDFYDRGGDRRSASCGDTTGLGATCSNLDADITDLGLSAQEKADLVEFLKALTDERVACHAAPFDHPALPIQHGHTSVPGPMKQATDVVVVLPPTGKDGLTAPPTNLGCFNNSGDLFNTNAGSIIR